MAEKNVGLLVLIVFLQLIKMNGVRSWDGSCRAPVHGCQCRGLSKHTIHLYRHTHLRGRRERDR